MPHEVRDLVKFGQVFIQCPETNQFILHEGLKFSNVDLLIYDKSTGDVYHGGDKLKGKKISLGFNIKNPDLLAKGATLVEFEGKMKVPLTYGEYRKPDLESLEKAEEFEKEWWAKLSSMSREEVDNRLEKSMVSSIWLLLSPGRPLLEQKLLLKTCPVVTFDDFLDGMEGEKGGEGKKISLPYGSLREVCQVLMDFVKSDCGTKASLNCLMRLAGAVQGNEGEYSNGYHLVERRTELLSVAGSVLEFLKGIRNEVVEVAQDTRQDPDQFIDQISEAWESYVIEFSQEWRGLGAKKSIPLVTRLRHEQIGMVPICDTIAFQNGIQLGGKVRENILYKMFVENGKKAAQKVNDLLSYAKECGRTEQLGAESNELYLLHKEKGVPLQEAMRGMLEEYNATVENLVEVGDILLQFFPEGKDEHEPLQKYLRIWYEATCGFVLYHGFTKRYHDHLVFDCYIEN